VSATWTIRPSVAWLATAKRIGYRAIEVDMSGFDCDDRRWAALKIRIVTKQQMSCNGHRRLFPSLNQSNGA
jgi:hypothetical protein